MYHPTMRPGAQRQLKNAGEADLVIGLPSYKNPQVAAQVARVALEGAHQHYPHLRTVLVNADAGQRATTRRAVLAQTSPNGHNSCVISGRYEGALGHGNAVAALLDAALALDAKAIIILDSHTQTITPQWIAGLAQLIFENRADLVIPRYRQWYALDGLMSDLIIYPLFRALWGQSVRRPAAPDFALSAQLATALLDEDIWGTAAATYGLPPWLVTYSAVGQWRIAQTALGAKECGNPQTVSSQKAVNAGFLARFEDVLSVMFSSVNKYQAYWQGVNGVRSLSTLTQFAESTDHTEPNMADTVGLLDELALGWIEYRTLWQRVLTPDNLAHIEALAALPPDRFHFPSDLWARIVYDFVVVFNKGLVDPAQVVSAFFPLFQGRLAAFEQEIAGLAPAGREGTVAAQAVEFEEARPYLQRRWQNYQPSA